MDVLITGGCGFLGTNMTRALLERGERVRVLDNLSRRGTERNLDYMQSELGSMPLEVLREDIRDAEAVERAVADCDVVIHLAAQVAVTTSVDGPARRLRDQRPRHVQRAGGGAPRGAPPPPCSFSSTNKVYGGMEDVVVEEGERRYATRDLPHGVAEEQPLDFHSPYGCSKGAADQYVRDYARIYGLRTVVFAPVLHLRPAPVRHRGPGLGGAGS